MWTATTYQPWQLVVSRKFFKNFPNDKFKYSTKSKEEGKDQ